jgi:BirA family biotin operon repressor/biotin-[acetyl-CoA-carboxylase] ligase
MPRQGGATRPGALGTPHLHLRLATSTNDRARELAAAGAPHGALVTASEQSAGRGRQGRTWSAPPGHALLMSLVVRGPLPELLPLAAGLAVAAACSPDALVKWPNDVLLPAGEDLRKLAGVLTEARPQEGWAVVGIGVNVAVRLADLPPELRESAATLGLEPGAVAGVRDRVLSELERLLETPPQALLEELRGRDALAGRPVSWAGGSGVAAGIDGAGRLVVELEGGGRTELDAGEVHLAPPAERARD